MSDKPFVTVCIRYFVTGYSSNRLTRFKVVIYTLLLHFKVVRTRNGFGERLGNNTSDDLDGDGEADEGILYQKIYIKILYKNFISILANHI